MSHDTSDRIAADILIAALDSKNIVIPSQETDKAAEEIGMCFDIIKKHVLT